MAEYIDKNATVGILEAMSRSADCECIKKRLEKAAKRVNIMPAADVAPVVRCKNCRKFKTYSCRMVASGYDDFCSYGERKDGGNGHENDG